MSKLITRKTSDNYRSVNLDALTPVSEPSCEIEEDVVKDYTVYDSIVDSLNLTENMRIALECGKRIELSRNRRHTRASTIHRV